MHTMDNRQPDADPEADASPSPAEESTGISKDDAFHVLQNSRRRAVLRYLLDRDEPQRLQMRDVAEAVAAWEHGTTTEQLTSDQRQRVYIALYQSHLPKLDELGVIEYDQARGIVEPTRLLAVFAPFLEAGLEADTQRLTVDDVESDDAASSNARHGVVNTLSSFFDR